MLWQTTIWSHLGEERKSWFTCLKFLGHFPSLGIGWASEQKLESQCRNLEARIVTEATEELCFLLMACSAYTRTTCLGAAPHLPTVGWLLKPQTLLKKMSLQTYLQANLMEAFFQLSVFSSPIHRGLWQVDNKKPARTSCIFQMYRCCRTQIAVV